MLIRKFKQVLITSVVLLSTTSASAAEDYCCPDLSACASEWCCGVDAEVYMDFLYWQTGVGGLEFARQDGISSSASTAITSDGAIFDVDCNFEPGFRAGVIFDLCRCNWDFFTDYTYLYERYGTTASLETQSGGVVPAGLAPLIFSNGGLSDLSEATGNWDNRLQVLNAGFGRTFDACGCFLFRPHFGIKATWQTMKTRIVYDRRSNVFLPTTRDTLTFRNEFNGIGLRGGLDTTWVFNSCMRLVGNMSMSGVWSDMCLTRHDIRATVLNDGQVLNSVTNVDLKERLCVLVPVLELLWGFRFDTCICCSYPAYVFIGWENQVWFDLNRMILFGTATSGTNNMQFGPQGNVHYQGLVVRAGLGF